MAKKPKVFRVRSESQDGKQSRISELTAEDADEARFLEEQRNRELAKSDSAPEGKPYKIVGKVEVV